MSGLVLCVSAGRGPSECRQGVVAVAACMREEALSHGLAFSCESDEALPASLLLSVDGIGAETFARSWEGSVRWIAKSTLRPGHRRKNWFIAVRRVSAPVELPLVADADLRFEALRAGGPGGQHQNRTESAVRAVHLPTGIAVVARDERSQHRNKSLAVARLRALLAAMHERDRDTARFSDWLARVSVERGNAVRTLRDTPEGPRSE
ncbi:MULTISPECIES: peptide chain release factor H [unclassified Chelatococcus]|uniref:peptide chain release factor H n=1 Tax=unclassified Chelatococcus TaxID=2638111 RepID=UPI001BCAF313|nr:MULTISPECIES: peptide chain release factor H [unclassified Chelatococcus]MBS7696451.1 peptide chain release factor H [Chelatococcus sp. YT9]MBX3557061.1 peptide chain release factor H [Chelatococcus sp.]